MCLQVLLSAKYIRRALDVMGELMFWGWGVPYKWMRCLLEILKIKNKDAKVVFCGWGLIFAILKRHQS